MEDKSKKKLIISYVIFIIILIICNIFYNIDKPKYNYAIINYFNKVEEIEIKNSFMGNDTISIEKNNGDVITIGKENIILIYKEVENGT